MLNTREIPKGIPKIKPLHASQIKRKSEDLSPNEFEKAMQFAWKMIVACQEWGGIGLAAPQLGAFKKIIVLRDFKDDNLFRVCFNPAYLPNKEEGTVDMAEGCLSVPGKTVEVPRWQTIVATWVEQEDGVFVEKQYVLSDDEARVFQHEVDHLSGVSILDRGRRV